jgi:hypothetical protein
MVTNPNVPNVLTPEQIVEQLRALMAQVTPVVPLTAAQRQSLRAKTRVPQAVVEASINVIGAADSVSQALGVPVADVHQMVDEATRWMAVEGEFRAALNGIAGANLVRRQRIVLVTGQGYNIARQLTRDPEHAALVPHVDEVKRLRKLSNRKKTASSAPAPAPETPKEQ